MMQYLSDKPDSASELTGGLKPKPVLRAFEDVTQDMPFDDARMNAIAAVRQAFLGDVAQEALKQVWVN